jgi:hypothetical protein
MDNRLFRSISIIWGQHSTHDHRSETEQLLLCCCLLENWKVKGLDFCKWLNWAIFIRTLLIHRGSIKKFSKSIWQTPYLSYICDILIITFSLKFSSHQSVNKQKKKSLHVLPIPFHCIYPFTYAVIIVVY